MKERGIIIIGAGKEWISPKTIIETSFIESEEQTPLSAPEPFVITNIKTMDVFSPPLTRRERRAIERKKKINQSNNK